MIPLSLNAKIILIRPDRIGDVVITSTCFASLREKFPSAQIYFAADERMQPLFDKTSSLTDFLPLSNLSDRKKSFLKTLKKIKPDAIIHFHSDEMCYKVAAQADIPVRIGWKKKFISKYLTHSVPDIRSEGKQHEALYNFDLLSFLSIQSPSELKLEISPTLAAQENLKRKLPWPIDKIPYAVIHPTSAHKIRRWPAERFAELARWLMEKKGLHIVSIGAPLNDPFSQAFAKATQDISVVRLEGKLDLAETAWLLRSAKLLVSCDSGPSHIAAAVNCPQVMIFGRTEPIYGPTRWKALNNRAAIVSALVKRKFLESTHAFWKRGFDSISIETVQKTIESNLKL